MKVCRAAYLGLAVFGLVAHVLLGLGAPVSPLWLPGCLLIGGGYFYWDRRQTRPGGPAADTWVLGCTVAAILAVCVAFVLDLARIPFHDWDAVAAWSPKTRHLLQEPSLDQPFFQDVGVWHHSRDYPLLQPLCLASAQALVGEAGGRLLFVALYVWMVWTTGLALRHAGAGGNAACVAAGALGLTPILVDPTSGGFTSGYADAFLATAVTGAAAGLILRDGWLLGAGTVLMILLKPEGLVYAGLFLAVPWFRGERRLLVSGVTAFVLAAGLWLPIQLRLQQANVAHPALVLWPGLLGLGLLLIGGQRWLEHRPTWVLVWVAVLAGALWLALIKVVATGLGQQQGSLTAYFQDLGRMANRIHRLPEILWGLFYYLLYVRKLGLLFVFLVTWGLLQKRLRPWTSPSTASALWLLLGLAAPCLVMPYLLSTEEDLPHHMRSSMGRLWIHWLGAGWLLAGLGVGQLLAEANAQEQAHDPRSRQA